MPAETVNNVTKRQIIAILRGIRPDEALAVGECLLEAGISQLEVPLNSPEPLASIRSLVDHFGQRALIGAGTVLDTKQVERVADTGAKLVVSPNFNPAVIRRSQQLGLSSLPGVMTPTECFAALDAGANGLKFFPALKLGLDGFQALQAVLPADTRTYAVGGVGAADFSRWLSAGITGFGIGSALYQPGYSTLEVGAKAKTLVEAWNMASWRLNE